MPSIWTSPKFDHWYRVKGFLMIGYKTSWVFYHLSLFFRDDLQAIAELNTFPHNDTF